MVAAVRGTARVRPAATRVGVLGATKPVPVVVALVGPETPVEAQVTAAVTTEAATATLAVPRVVMAVDLAATGELGAATAAVVLEDTAGMAEAMLVTAEARVMAAVGAMADKRPRPRQRSRPPSMHA